MAVPARRVVVQEHCSRSSIMGKRPILATTAGNPVIDNQTAVTAGARGRNVLVIALFLVAIAIPARAGTPTDLPAPPLAESLDAMRHHQPTDEQVQKLEEERYGRQKAEEQQRREKAEVNQLYDDAMRLSAPVASHPPPKPGS
jgi:hypothetical protein